MIAGNLQGKNNLFKRDELSLSDNDHVESLYNDEQITNEPSQAGIPYFKFKQAPIYLPVHIFSGNTSSFPGTNRIVTFQPQQTLHC